MRAPPGQRGHLEVEGQARGEVVLELAEVAVGRGDHVLHPDILAVRPTRRALLGARHPSNVVIRDSCSVVIRTVLLYGQ